MFVRISAVLLCCACKRAVLVLLVGEKPVGTILDTYFLHLLFRCLRYGRSLCDKSSLCQAP